MIPSVSMWSFDRLHKAGSLSQADFLLWAKKNGLQYVELLSCYMGEERDRDIDRIFRMLAELELSVSCYTIQSDFTRINFHLSKGFQADLDMAQRLKSPYVRILTGGQSFFSENIILNIIEGIGSAVEEASKRGLVLVLENIGPYSGRVENILRIVESVNSPFLRINFDTANPLLSGEDPLWCLEKMMNYISYVHVKDFITQRNSGFEKFRNIDEERIQSSDTGILMTGTVSGNGEVPVNDILLQLKNSDYEGFLSIEYEGLGDCEKDVHNSLEYLHRNLN